MFDGPLALAPELSTERGACSFYQVNGPKGARDSADVDWAEPVDGHVIAFGLLARGTPFDPFTKCMVDGSAQWFAIERDVVEPFLSPVLSRGTQSITRPWLLRARRLAASRFASCIGTRSAHDREWSSPAHSNEPNGA